jgi:UDP-glucose 4-epimerase
MDAFGAYTEVMIRWLERLSQGKPPQIFGDGSQTMDFVFVGDVARANLLAAVSETTDDVMNVGTGVETSLNELEPVHVEARTVNGVTRRCASTTNARDRIGFTTSVGLREGLGELVAWYVALPGLKPVPIS